MTDPTLSFNTSYNTNIHKFVLIKKKILKIKWTFAWADKGYSPVEPMLLSDPDWSVKNISAFALQCMKNVIVLGCILKI